ncbi:MAG: hypothetical protein NTU79_09765 [Planctomycetota bacterium]|nr:hypothetical protein [Planctomycetota bacterium]
MRILFGFFACLAISLAGSNSVFAAWVYNANKEFVEYETTPGNSGPNLAPSFSNFQAGTSLTLGGFTPFASTLHTDSWNGYSDLQGWRQPQGFQASAVVVNTSTAPVTALSVIGPIDPSQILMHGGLLAGDPDSVPVGNAVLRFTASNEGYYSIIGDWESLDSGSTINYVLKNGSILDTDTSNLTQDFNLTNIFLGVNDTIDFVVTYDGSFINDSTWVGWDWARWNCETTSSSQSCLV